MNKPHGRSRLIAWAGKLGLVCLLSILVGIGLVRIGLPLGVGLGVFSLAVLGCALLTVLLVATAFAKRYRHHRRAAIISGLPVAPPSVLILGILIGSAQYPPIHDIATDTENPPVFDAAPRVRGESANPLDIKPATIALQKEHYPDLRGIETPLSEQEAFERAVEVAESLGWNLYNGGPAMGLMEASHTSRWFGFVDDIVLRFHRMPGGGTRIELRSVSRVGRGDLGANAKRLRAFVQRYERM